eukprot:SAG31_NODE_43428_length_267_cov_0.619048_1_plen_72_part_10
MYLGTVAQAGLSSTSRRTSLAAPARFATKEEVQRPQQRSAGRPCMGTAREIAALATPAAATARQRLWGWRRP